ncbi:NAD(+) diphosphatase [Sporanaerobium hydrogeniformans]|uniref:NAD(+) diphosphatase n=1 Tax=Sporanaerobium hydrogeniformans TaxID=3072179 RepID=A0AC61DA06_9FIRM|nr:NAD(+) diphosphatase [Sporanaerobium hydrogeniformans]PHV69501.1 NAD(+) diphosphatase [Sporanaerobium hydrogeniformans]
MEYKREDIPFRPEYKELETRSEKTILLIYKKNHMLLLKARKNVEAPDEKEHPELKKGIKEKFFMGYFREVPCYCTEWQEKVPIPEAFEWVYLNDASWIGDKNFFFTCVRGRTFLNWHHASRFCGYCGEQTTFKEDERAKRCLGCGNVSYPHIAPAIIVGVTKGDKLLLAHNANFPEGLYSIIAGYVEQGESLEQAVRREVEEEVGIKVKNIKYYGSTPWYNGDSLMLGFTAEYESGEITVDHEEIVDANWYDKDNFPILPSPISIAHQIITDLLGLSK